LGRLLLQQVIQGKSGGIAVEIQTVIPGVTNNDRCRTPNIQDRIKILPPIAASDSHVSAPLENGRGDITLHGFGLYERARAAFQAPVASLEKQKL
ncbi:MAG: hypothetical protein CME21_16330, partial [Gemmatimonadetes bacterium]|nr:hypothetical protein [Gemmatimonadota bacterium]